MSHITRALQDAVQCKLDWQRIAEESQSRIQQLEGELASERGHAISLEKSQKHLESENKRLTQSLADRDAVIEKCEVALDDVHNYFHHYKQDQLVDEAIAAINSLKPK